MKHNKHDRTVQPIRNAEDRKAMSRYLRSRSLRDYTLFEFGLRVGRRVSDLVRLNVSDVARIDSRGRMIIKSRLVICEGKTQKFASILLNNTARRVLSLYLAQRRRETGSLDKLLNEALFISKRPRRDGTYRLTRQWVYEMLREAARACDLDFKVGTHSLRKTFGYDMHKHGVDITLIQKIMNHTSPEITLAYIGITQNDADRAIRNLYV